MSHTITKLKESITQDFIEEIESRLADNNMIRRTLPSQGRLHIDRKLPFLVVYRRPSME